MSRASEGGAGRGKSLEGIDLKTLKRLTRLMEDAGLVELEVEAEGMKVKLMKAGAPAAHAPAPAAAPAVPAAPAPAGAPAPTALPAPAAPTGHVVKSPMVGTFYRSPSPQAPPFVNAGDEVKEGQTLCLIEAMKLMNEIKCDRAGKVARVLVENGQPVEFDQPLIELA